MRLLACSIGNTTVAFGCFVDGRLAHRWSVQTSEARRTPAHRLLAAAARGTGCAAARGAAARGTGCAAARGGATGAARGTGCAKGATWGAAGVARATRGTGCADVAVVCSVVPALNGRILRVLRAATAKPPIILTPDFPHGLSVGYAEPARFGADRLAAVLGARARLPGRDLVVIDCGTATTLTAVKKGGFIAGGAILPGMGLWAGTLAHRTAQLPLVPLRRPRAAAGRSPEAAISAGVWFGHLGAVKELLGRISKEAFGPQAQPVVVATGGNASSLHGQGLVDITDPDLALRGLQVAAARLLATPR